MVSLKVTAIVIPEDQYLNEQDDHRSTTPLSRGKKLLVATVYNPDDWVIGQLAIQAGRKYRSLYHWYVCSAFAFCALYLRLGD